MEGTAYVFWVDLGFRLRSRKRVPLQGSRGVTDTPSCSCYSCYTCTCSCYTCTCSCYTCSWLPYGRSWFSTRGLGRGPGYARDPPKIQTMSPTDHFQ